MSESCDLENAKEHRKNIREREWCGGEARGEPNTCSKPIAKGKTYRQPHVRNKYPKLIIFELEILWLLPQRTHVHMFQYLSLSLFFSL